MGFIKKYMIIHRHSVTSKLLKKLSKIPPFYDILLLSSIKGDFPQQGPRYTCDCISGPRLIPAFLWGHPAHIMRARGSAHIRKSGRCTTTPPWILGL